MITISKEESRKIKSDDQSLFIRFPYNPQLVNIMRGFRRRWWHHDEKVWELPLSELDYLLSRLEGFQYDLQFEKADDKQEIDSFIYKTEPYSHQIEGVLYGLNKNNFLLADEQGLGKTKQVIDIAITNKRNRGYKHCLIICGVNGLKWNWRDEIEIHSEEKAHILGTRLNTRGKEVIPSSIEKLEDLENIDEMPYFIITNIETLRYKQTIKTKTGKNKTVYSIQEKISELTEKGVINMVVVDEIHKCKNPNSQQGKALLKIDAQTKIAMTGTPLMNHPLDLYIIMKWLGYTDESFYRFKNGICIFGGYGGYQVVGYKNLKQLQREIDNYTIRRLKSSVLDLPPKIKNIEYVEMGIGQERIYNQVLDAIVQDIDKIKTSPNPLSQLIRLRQATADTSILSSKIQESAKLDRLEELVEEAVDNGEKVIVFSNWTNVTDIAYKRLSKYNPALITGKTSDREEQQNKFKTDDTCRVIIGTIGAMGTGLTLTEASTVIFLDSPWNRALKDQAEDRAHRIGTKEPVHIITLVCKNTIDEKIEKLINKKGVMSDALVDNQYEITDELIDYLLT